LRGPRTSSSRLKELAPYEDQGIAFGAIDVPANATLEQITPYTGQVFSVFSSVPEFKQSFQITFPKGGFGGVMMKPWEERERSIFAIQAELSQKAQKITGIRAPVFLPPALPNAGFFPIELVIASTESHDALSKYAEELVKEATKSGQFAFPPIMDVRIDQAKSDIVIDRDKVASLGLTMQQVGADLASLLGGSFVNRFSMEGRSYKVIAQIERAGRLSTDQLRDLHVTGPNGLDGNSRVSTTTPAICVEGAARRLSRPWQHNTWLRRPCPRTSRQS
jgi:multidrug efflux pump